MLTFGGLGFSPCPITPAWKTLACVRGRGIESPKRQFSFRRLTSDCLVWDTSGGFPPNSAAFSFKDKSHFIPCFCFYAYLNPDILQKCISRHVNIDNSTSEWSFKNLKITVTVKRWLKKVGLLKVSFEWLNRHLSFWQFCVSKPFLRHRWWEEKQSQIFIKQQESQSSCFTHTKNISNIYC